MWGQRPYDKQIEPRENIFVSATAFGEGYHNYHHTFPWDYATSENGSKLNATKIFIDLMALIGQAYDLKSCTPEMIKRRVYNSLKKSTNNTSNYNRVAQVNG